MAKICLDSDIILDFLEGRKATIEKLKHYIEKEEIVTTSVVMFEVLSSVKSIAPVLRFMEQLDILVFDKQSAELASKLYRDGMKEGIRIPSRAIINAAICMRNDAFLLTKNRNEYEGIKGLKVV
ncbi:MAG: type II toxin-antitoxin system VapC family toxin [Candidatus Anstonellales archaeon]